VTGLLDELRADQDPRSQCRFCAWLKERTAPERDEWAKAMSDRSYTQASLFRAARKRGYAAGLGSIEGHRRSAHA